MHCHRNLRWARKEAARPVPVRVEPIVAYLKRKPKLTPHQVNEALNRRDNKGARPCAISRTVTLLITARFRGCNLMAENSEWTENVRTFGSLLTHPNGHALIR